MDGMIGKFGYVNLCIRLFVKENRVLKEQALKFMFY